jgi:glucose-1-phosphate thymidylyltransferase
MTRPVTKQLLPVYDKPMVYYPLSVLLMAGIRDVLLITTPADIERYRAALGDGSQWGIDISYTIQPEPGGLAQAYLIGRNFVNGGPSALVLGDNIFYGQGLAAMLQEAANLKSGARVFAYHVRDPERYGVVEFDGDGRALSIEEKPSKPRSQWAVTGLYFYDGQAPDIAASLKPSPRGELEITDLNRHYLKDAQLQVDRMGRGYAWFDTGTPDALIEAAHFVQTVYHRQGTKIACLEETAWRKGFIDDAALAKLAEQYRNSEYGKYLGEILREGKHAW